jgi:hypothetical protein
MKRQITTTLLGKEEEFKMLELANTLSLPILFIGKPGISKTKIVLDYFNATHQNNNPESVFILETDESTPNSAIKGNVDLEKLFTQNRFETIAPITISKCILINEIDKSSSMIRNSLLGIMNERFLFAGKEKIQCSWDLFVATCNQIPRQERNSPFFDRFMIKHEVNGISSKQMMEYYNNGGRKYQSMVEVNCATKEAMDEIFIPDNKLSIFVELFLETLSNRTLTYLPDFIKAIICIWKLDIDQAMVKCAEIMISRDAAVKLISKLYSETQLAIISKVELLRMMGSSQQKEICIKEINTLLNKYQTKEYGCSIFVNKIKEEIKSIVDCESALYVQTQATLN